MDTKNNYPSDKEFEICANQCQLCGAYIHKYLNRKLSELQ